MKVIILGNGYMANEIKQYIPEARIISSSAYNYHCPKVLQNLLYVGQYTHVINCSGFTGRPNVDEAEHKVDECMYLNVVSPKMVADVCDEVGVTLIHLSSGCIYSGYGRVYTEEDKPDFGIYDQSSTYSKSKHMFELVTRRNKLFILRLRMPFSKVGDERSYLTKIHKYDNLIDYKNSKSSTEDVSLFIKTLIDKEMIPNGQDIYNVVNGDPLYTSSVVDIMQECGYNNPNWKFVPLSDLDIVAPRSNCQLNNIKALTVYPLRSEKDALLDLLSK
jgi:dTDP-4-dehydrorhamnose reductase